MSGLLDHFTQCGKIQISPSDVAYHLSVSDRVSTFHLVGTRGAQVLSLSKNLHNVATIRPDIVILDIGTNIDVLNKDCRCSITAILTWVLENVKISALPLNSIGN